jgi:hypothetical protein
MSGENQSLLGLPKWVIGTAVVAAALVLTILLVIVIVALSKNKPLDLGILGSHIGWAQETKIDALGWSSVANDTSEFNPECEYKIVVISGPKDLAGWGKNDGVGSVIYPSLVGTSLLSVDWSISPHPLGPSVEHFNVDHRAKGNLMYLSTDTPWASVQVKQRCGPITK